MLETSKIVRSSNNKLNCLEKVNVLNFNYTSLQIYLVYT